MSFLINVTKSSALPEANLDSLECPLGSFGEKVGV